MPEVKGWYAGRVARADDNEVGPHRTEAGATRVERHEHPTRQVRDSLFAPVGELARSEFSSLRHAAGEHTGEPCFTCGYGVLLINITRARLDEAGLSPLFPPERALCRDELADLERAGDREAMRRLKRLFAVNFPFDPLTEDQVKTLKRALHREVVVRRRPATAASPPGGQPLLPGSVALDVLDALREQAARSTGSGHQVVFVAVGSGKIPCRLPDRRPRAGEEGPDPVRQQGPGGHGPVCRRPGAAAGRAPELPLLKLPESGSVRRSGVTQPVRPHGYHLLWRGDPRGDRDGPASRGLEPAGGSIMLSPAITKISRGEPSMRDENRLRRQWALLRALTSRHLGLSVRQMADELGVTARTIRRDLDVFRSVGFPLEEDVGEYGRKTWRVKAARDQPPLAFTFDEAVALYLGRRLLEPLAGTPFGEAARHAFGKIRAALGPGALRYIEQFSPTFHETGAAPRDYAPKSDLIDGLLVAIEDGKEARLLYRSEEAAVATGRVVHPHGMIYHRGALYLVAFAPKDGKIKHYKVDRIEGVEVGGTAVRPHEGFDLAAYMASAFGVYKKDGKPTLVRVRFGPPVARYVQESRWHESQRLTPQRDGAVVAEYLVSGTDEIKHWVLGFGARAVVLEPESLRQEIVGELRDLATAYATPDHAVDPHAGGGDEPRADRRPRTREAASRES